MYAAIDLNFCLDHTQYSFRLAFTNPLFDPITISLSILPPIPLLPRPSTEATPSTTLPKPPFHISLPLTSFPVSAFADPWEYQGADDEDDIDALLEGTAAAEPKTTTLGRKSKAAGKEVLLERRGNVTEVGMEVRVGRGAKEGAGLDVSTPSHHLRANGVNFGPDLT